MLFHELSGVQLRLFGNVKKKTDFYLFTGYQRAREAVAEYSSNEFVKVDAKVCKIDGHAPALNVDGRSTNARVARANSKLYY